MSDPSPVPREGQFLVYQTEDQKLKLEVRIQGETVWLSLNQLAALFQRDKSVISRHINNIFEEGELDPAGTVAKSATVQTEGGKQGVHVRFVSDVSHSRGDAFLTSFPEGFEAA